MSSGRRRVTALVVALVAGLAGTYAVTQAFGASPSDTARCASIFGTAKTGANLSASTPQAASMSFLLRATGCTAPAVNAVAVNGPATEAQIKALLKSRSAMCVLSDSGERPWGRFMVKWKNAAGDFIVDATGREVADHLFVRLDPDGIERYDLHGFDFKGPTGGGDMRAEIGLERQAACDSGPMAWVVASDFNLLSTGEQVGGDGNADDLRIAQPATPSTGSSPFTTTTGSQTSWTPSSPSTAPTTTTSTTTTTPPGS